MNNKIIITANNKPTVITVSATDPMGLSGIHADLRALESMDVHGACCITATTAQNQSGFSSLNPISNTAFISQLDSLANSVECNVIKIGLLANSQQAKTLLKHPIFKGKKIVLDPVLSASSGDIEQYEDRLKGLRLLLPFVDVITPNLNEVVALLEGYIKDIGEKSIESIAQYFLKTGVKSVLIKGGHSEQQSVDYYCEQAIQFYLKHDVYEHSYSRGTGCAMASLIAASLALGANKGDAITMAKMQMQTGWKSPFKITEDAGSLVFKKWISPEAYSKNTEQEFKDNACLPVELPIVFKTSAQQDLLFPSCEQPLGLYPIVDRADWLERLLPVGISTAQLRIKDLTGDALRKEIARAVNIAKQYKCQLFINDYWQLAIDCDAYGVHLGQEDIDDADLQAISDAGLRLGLSSHCFHEVARAKSINPSYIAFGPVYETQSKDMPWVPKGPVGLRYWRQHLSGIPMVAIGGIHGDRFEEVEKTGIDGIAMITAITLAPNPVATAIEYKDRFSLKCI